MEYVFCFSLRVVLVALTLFALLFCFVFCCCCFYVSSLVGVLCLFLFLTLYSILSRLNLGRRRREKKRLKSTATSKYEGEEFFFAGMTKRKGNKLKKRVELGEEDSGTLPSIKKRENKDNRNNCVFSLG